VSLTGRVLTGLVAGLVLGAMVAAFDSPPLEWAVSIIEPLGTLWVNAIRMTVIPLVVALLVGGIAFAPSAGEIGRFGVRAALLFAVFLAVSAAFSIVVAPTLIAFLPVDPAGAAALLEGATPAVTSEPRDRPGAGANRPSRPEIRTPPLPSPRSRRCSAPSPSRASRAASSPC